MKISNEYGQEIWVAETTIGENRELYVAVKSGEDGINYWTDEESLRELRRQIDDLIGPDTLQI
jgi:hypothetical protein